MRLLAPTGLHLDWATDHAALSLIGRSRPFRPSNAALSRRNDTHEQEKEERRAQASDRVVEICALSSRLVALLPKGRACRPPRTAYMRAHRRTGTRFEDWQASSPLLPSWNTCMGPVL